MKSEKYGMLKGEPGGAQSSLIRTYECPSLRQGCCMQRVVCLLVFWEVGKKVSVLLSGPLHTAVPASAFDRRERSVNGKKSHSPHASRMGGAACSCQFCQAGGLGCPLWLGIQVLVLSSAMREVLTSSCQSS